MNSLLLLTALLAEAPGEGGPYGLVETTGPGLDAEFDSVRTDGACATQPTGDVCCYDNNGVSCGMPITDAAPPTAVIRGHSGSPIGTGTNDDAANLVLAGGTGLRTIACTFANCSAGADTYTPTADGAAVAAITAHASTTSATLFSCGTTNATMCTNLAAAIDLAVPGVDTCTGAGCTAFTGVAGTAYVWETTGAQYSHATNDATAMALVSGADGQVLLQAGTTGLPALSCLGDTNTGINCGASADRVSLVASGSERFACNATNCTAGVASVILNGSVSRSTSNTALTLDDDIQQTGMHSQAAATITVNAATTFVATRNVQSLQCTGPETISTITRGTGISGAMPLYLISIDTECTIDDQDDDAADTIDLIGANTDNTMADDEVIILVHDGTLWREADPAAH